MSFHNHSIGRRGFLTTSVAALAAAVASGGWKAQAALPDPVAQVAEGLGDNAAVRRMGQRVRQAVPKDDLRAIESRIAPQLAADPQRLPVLVSADLRAGRTRSVGGVILSETETAVLAHC